MGIGGFVLVGYGQSALKQVEEKKFEHNQRVLNEAKQALLQYAYNYPQFNSEGPGRLPCPSPDTLGSPLLTGPSCTSVGRFPWSDTELNFYDARDADGEQLWYAVSSNFYNLGGGANIKSDQNGSITLVDQSQNIIYDGNGAGIAAIIIAPGPELPGQDRIANPDDPAHFMDNVNGFDNSVFTNDESDTNDDGFILGPVFDPAQNITVVNDQMIVITAAEVIEMAEKSVLQAYRAAIIDYLANTGGVYPWLYNYDNIGSLDNFPADLVFGTEFGTNLTLGNIGRIPSIFTDYFTETTSQPIETRLDVSVSMNFPITPVTVTTFTSDTPGPFRFNGECSGESPPLNPPTNAANCNSNAGLFTPTSTAFNFLTAGVLTGVQFQNIPDTVGQDGRLTGTVGGGDEQLITRELFFWDDDDAPTGIWTLCEDDGDNVVEASDCNRDSSGVPSPGLASNETHSELLHVVVEFDSSGVMNFDTDYTIPPVISAPVAATSASHATISATFSGASIISSPLTVRYEIDRHYHETYDIQEVGTLRLADLSLVMTLGMRYYPELPDWAFSNGWYDSVMMAYAPDYLPSSVSVPKDCVANPPCIRINNLAGNIDNKISILTLAGQHNWNDDAPLGDFTDDLTDVFDAENADILDVDGTEYLFDRKEPSGNDKILVIEER